MCCGVCLIIVSHVPEGGVTMIIMIMMLLMIMIMMLLLLMMMMMMLMMTTTTIIQQLSPLLGVSSSSSNTGFGCMGGGVRSSILTASCLDDNLAGGLGQGQGRVIGGGRGVVAEEIQLNCAGN